MNAFSMHFFIRAAMMAALACCSTLGHAGQQLVCLIQPSQSAEVGTSVTGVIENIPVERGDVVEKGQVIAVLRNDVEAAALNVAKIRSQADADVKAALAALQFAQQDTARTEDLFKRKFISEEAVNKARTEEQIAAQKLAQAREQRLIWERERILAQSQLDQRTIVSPISGIVAERYLSVGERVEDRAVARVVNINPLHVEAMVPAASYGKITAGMTASVVPELPDAQSVAARVILVDRLIDGASNTFRVRLELPNPDNTIPAGSRCTMAFADQVLGSPISANNLKAQTAVVRATTDVPPAVAVAMKRAAAPAAVKDVPNKVAAASDTHESALSALENWRHAWESKDMAGYLAAYVADFHGDQSSRDAWVKQREARINKPIDLDIRISDAQVEPVDDSQVRVQFRQLYQAGGYHATALKSLLMILEQGKWLIQEEHILP
jgi:cobalt-zinc-cadmium efflux system membrane fusion protein